MSILTPEQLTQLRPYGFDLRLPLVYDDEQLLPAWTTIVPVYENGTLHWPVRTPSCLIGILSGPLRGRIVECNTAEVAHALGHTA